MRLTRSLPRLQQTGRGNNRRSPRKSVSMALAAAQPALRAGHRESRPALDTSLIPPISLRKGRRHAAVRRFVVIGEVIALTLVLTASASTATVAHADTAVLAVAGSIDEVLTNIRNWLMGILASLATVFLTIGGVRRVFGGGDPAEHEKSKEAFKAAGIGYALAALAPLVVTVLKGIVGA